MLQTQGADIGRRSVTEERLAIFKVFMVAAGVMVVLSFVARGAPSAGRCGGLAEKRAGGAGGACAHAAEIGGTNHLPARRDSGHLSGSLRSMTSALYRRIEAIESFAAGRSRMSSRIHTDLAGARRSRPLPLARARRSRARLLEVIQHDVKRLDRLISDISDASRLDAEMQRQDAEPVDLKKLLTMVVNVRQRGARRRMARVVR